jgi:hypothetical protein
MLAQLAGLFVVILSLVRPKKIARLNAEHAFSFFAANFVL